MTADAFSAADLLRRLSSGVQPAGAPGAQRAPGAGIESSSFSELLRLAREGGIEASRPLRVSRDVRAPFSEQTMDALALATDAAEAAGATRLAAVVEGKTVTVDVVTREIVATGENTPGALITDADAFVVIPNDTGTPSREDRAGSLGYPSSMPSNPSLADALARVADLIARRVG